MKETKHDYQGCLIGMSIKVNRYFRTINHPLGDGLYLKLSMEFENEENAEKFKNMEINWEENIEVVEISQKEYLENTEEDEEIDIKEFIEEIEDVLIGIL
ncbi:hypothetical protein [uncultured Tyzzerella sp.]|uniref:hypothetical protein n=1 Tax=uncultured Tyzzerella sp. TaxID=2321398 RepID=UPI0029422123|nr:hypothetical protein [uncultured Tyzzerella sp.]